MLKFNFGFCDGGTLCMVKKILFYDLLYSMVIMMSIFVFFTIYFIGFSSYVYMKFLDCLILELIWTLVPGVMLLFMALPSLSNLYYNDFFFNSFLVKNINKVSVVGNQWFWSYNNFGVYYDSYQSNCISGVFNYFDVSKPLFLYVNNFYRFLISSIDVIHSFSINSFGLKIDAIPGRVNVGGLYLSNVGIFYGQCSELCGENHSFMPIMVEVI